MRTRLLLILILALAALSVVACGGGGATSTAPEIDVSTLPDTVDVQTVHAVKDSPNVFLLDVREPWEYEEGHIPGITLIPMAEVASRLDEIPTDKEVIVTCRTGNRSGQIADLLRDQGFDNVHNMDGGIVAWQEAGFDVEQ